MGGTGSGQPYILAATVILPADDTTDLRQTLIGLKPKRAKKLHWTDAQPDEQDSIVDTIQSFGFDHIAVARTITGDDDDRRNRRTCIEQLMHYIQQIDVTEVVFESRGAAQDRQDMKMLDALRARRQVGPGGLRFSHAPAPRLPLLWIPDTIAGVAGAALSGDTAHSSRFGDRLRMVEFEN